MDEQNLQDDKLGGMSSTTLAVLIIVAIVISVIGTWAVINSVHTATPEYVGGDGTNAAKINLNIQQPPATATSDTTGKVVLDIQKP